MNILGYEYRLEIARSQKDIGLAGQCFTGDEFIEIANDLPTNTKTSTLLHEIIEALNYHLEMKLDHYKICDLEVGLFQVLVENGVDLSPLLSSAVTDILIQSEPEVSIELLPINL